MNSLLVESGFQIVPSVLAVHEVEALRDALSEFAVAPGHRRLMERVPQIAALATASRVIELLTSLTGGVPFPVRSIFFDKTPEANWLVPWHQDLSIAVKAKQEVPGYGPWSMKEGVPHVQPPDEMLEAMITFRLHLDDCDESNGVLRVIPGSHRLGRLSAAQIAEIRRNEKEVMCSARAGDVLLMRPLLLHASSQATVPNHRRVVHLEYAMQALAGGLDWAETVVPSRGGFDDLPSSSEIHRAPQLGTAAATYCHEDGMPPAELRCG